jgi:hypothetical protein
MARTERRKKKPTGLTARPATLTDRRRPDRARPRDIQAAQAQPESGVTSPARQHPTNTFNLLVESDIGRIAVLLSRSACQGSRHLQIFSTLFALVRNNVERDLGALDQRTEARLLHRRDMDEHVLAATAVRLKP